MTYTSYSSSSSYSSSTTKNQDKQMEDFRYLPGVTTLRLDDEWENNARPVHKWLVDLMTFRQQRRYGYR